MAHRYRDTRKEVHLLSGPSELRPLEAMAHRDTRKEAHLLSRPSELQPTEDLETQKFNSAHVQQTRQEYSRLTETEKAKFQNPFIYNDDRNFVRHNSVDTSSPNLVFMTTPNTSVSNSVFCRKKGRKTWKMQRQQKQQKDLHLHLQQKDLYLHLHLQPHWSDHTPRTRKSSLLKLWETSQYI